MKHFLIGIYGDIGSGKDTLAACMQKTIQAWGGHPCYVRAMAHALRMEVAAWLRTNLPTNHPAFGNLEKCFELLVNRDTKERYRGLLRWWGTQYRRELFWDAYWIDMHRVFINGLDSDSNAVIVVPDIRYPNEADYITNNGGVILQVIRPELIADRSHCSDTGMDNYVPFHDVVNSGTLEDLQAETWKICATLIDWKWGSDATSSTTVQCSDNSRQ